MAAVTKLPNWTAPDNPIEASASRGQVDERVNQATRRCFPTMRFAAVGGLIAFSIFMCSTIDLTRMAHLTLIVAGGVIGITQIHRHRRTPARDAVDTI